MNAVQFPGCQPTHQLDHITRFYTEGLGMPIIGGFKDHEGYDGVMLGLPDATSSGVHQHSSQGPLPEPTAENLLVFYFDDRGLPLCQQPPAAIELLSRKA